MNTHFVFTQLWKRLNFGLLLFFIWNCQSEPTPDQILQKSIQAHGGETWKNASSISYLKHTTLLDKNGFVEKKVLQKITHQWNPFQTKIEWENQGTKQLAILNQSGVRLYHNDELQSDSTLIEKTKKNLNAAFYVFWQPFKLQENAVHLEYIGQEKLLDSILTHKLKVYYPNAKNDDLWYFYFDVSSFRLRATEVNHDQRVSLITNETVESQTGLFLNKTRNSYFLDSLGSIQYLRATYKYDIIEFIRD